MNDFGEYQQTAMNSDPMERAFRKDGAAFGGRLPASTLLARKVFRKISGGKVMIRKFLIWKTNKEESGKFPAYVFFYTDYSSGRGDFLKRDLRISESERQIRSIMNEFIAGNIRKGWQKVV